MPHTRTRGNLQSRCRVRDERERERVSGKEVRDAAVRLLVQELTPFH
jgi:hypothetical protein